MNKYLSLRQDNMSPYKKAAWAANRNKEFVILYQI
jgi:hypothetical protein